MSVKSPAITIYFLLLLLTAKPQGRNDQPVANPQAVLVYRDVRFTVLTPQLIRMEWDSNGRFENKASLIFVNRKLPVPVFTVTEKNEWITIATNQLELHYKRNSGRFTPDNLSISFHMNGLPVVWKPGMKDPQNLKGTTRTLDDTDGDAGNKITLEEGILSRSGWALIDDSNSLLFDGDPDWNWVTQKQGKGQDLYFFGYGHDYKKALYDFSRTAGQIPMLPKFAFGYWWSRYWTYSDAELRNLVNDFKTYHVPVDVLIIDMDWHETWGLDQRMKRDEAGELVGWTGYTWNKDLFPEPSAFLQWTKERHLKTALNLHPASGIAPMESQYPLFAKDYAFDTSQKRNIPFRIEEKKWAEIYFKDVIHPLEKQGIDFWWLDWQQWLMNKTIPALSNTWWLNYTFFSDKERQHNDRPFLFHRWGGLGNHRYQAGFSGDTHSTWSSLAYQPYFTATAGNVGYGYWSHDIGGHINADNDPELYLRWIQYGVFTPVLRTHCGKSPLNERRIWKFPDQYKAMLDALHLRYQLVPYIYTASRKAFDTGITLCRPMYYDYPENAEAYQHPGQYMFGDDMIVAPVTAKADTVTRLSSQKVWLPEGDWYDLFTGTMLKGGQVLQRKYALDEIPVFVKAGSLLPMYSEEVNNLQGVIDTLVLTVIPGTAGEALLYEDDGISPAYKQDGFARTKIQKSTSPQGLVTLIVQPRKGAFRGMRPRRSYEVRFLSTFPPDAVTVNGEKYSFSENGGRGTWSYESDRLVTVVHISPRLCSAQLNIRLSPQKKDKVNWELLNEKAGLFQQLPHSVELMKYETAKVDGIANIPGRLMQLAVTPSLIKYHPAQAEQLLEQMDKKLLPALQELKNYPVSDEAVLRRIIEPLVKNSPLVKTVDDPVISITRTGPLEPGVVTMTCFDRNAEIRYTLDGSLPVQTSPVYTQPISLTRTTQIKARSFKKDELSGYTVLQQYERALVAAVDYQYPCSRQYIGDLADGTLGVAKNIYRGWMGFNGNDLVATITLKDYPVQKITSRFLQSQGKWIFLPRYIRYEISEDGINYKNVYEKETDPARHDSTGIFEFSAVIPNERPRYIRITAKNVGQCPVWHPGAGQKAWLFTDELILE